MKTAAYLLAAATIVLGVISQLVDDPWHRYSALTGAAILAVFAGFAGLVAWLQSRPPEQSAGAGALSPPRRPAPAGVHRRRP